MNDPTHTYEIIRNIDQATGGFVSHSFERLGDHILDKVLSCGRKKLSERTEERIKNSDRQVSVEFSAKLTAEILRNADGVMADEIIDLWANLLAKAITGQDRSIRPVYFEVISKLSPMDALFMTEFGKPEMRQAMLVDLQSRRNFVGSFISQVNALLDKAGLDGDSRKYCQDALQRQGLIKIDDAGFCSMTIFGLGFYEAVCAPLTKTTRVP
ncbi:Abi-alpha family protein [Gluconobacter oxydans]|uniref:Abi-alpha family protein n=1 Tax=Gluconobacter oxydans TaxID=442 RepID=UPI001CD8C0CE|nr:Abi-alpha family protein [Gluconobacter oxydans]